MNRTWTEDEWIGECRDLEEKLEKSEAERDALRGEIMALREALDRLWEWFRYSDEPREVDAAIVIRSAQIATPRAAALGALIEAALTFCSIKADLDDFDGDKRGIGAALFEAEEALCAAADAVLVSEVRT